MPNNDYANEPNQSRSEEIIQSILDNTEYDEAARSRIEYLLIELKNAIEGGGGGGGVTSYSPLTEKPKIDNHTLQAGNNTSSDLGLQTKLTFDSTPTESSTNPVTSGGVYTALGAKANSADVYNKSSVDTALSAKADKSTTYTKTEVDAALSSKQNTISDLSTIRSGAALGATAVQPVSGKGLSTNDYTTAEKEKLAGIEAQANKTTVDSALSESSTNPVQNKVVKSALDGKQAALTTAQLAAVNSGVTSTDVAQIGLNKNNILLLYNQNGKTFNLFDINRPIDVAYHATAVVADNAITIGSVSGDWAYVGVKALNVPAGSYRVSGKISNLVTGAAGSTRIVVSQYSSASQGSLTYVNITQNGDFSNGFIWTGGDIYLLFYVNNTSSSSANYTYTASDLQIISTSAYNAGFTNYQPYALSNAAITPALKECVDNGVKNLLDFSGSTPIAPPNCTMTNNGDGTYTITKTSENLDIPYIAAQLKAGTYIYSGCPAGGSDSTYRLDIRTSTGSVVGEGDYGSGVKVTIPSDGWYRITCRLNSTYTTTGLTIKPMLCDPALWAISPTFEPHAMSNAELTAKEQTNENNISSKPTRYIIDTGQSNTTTKSFDISTMPNGMYMLTHTNFTGATTKYGISVYMIYLLNGEVDCFTAMKEVNSAIITSITASDNTATITYGTTGYHETTALYLYKN